MIGQKGPERLDRSKYPPMTLEPVSANAEGTGQAWAYHAKDSATGAEVTVHLVRQPCEDLPAANTLPETLPKPPANAGSAMATAGKNSFTVAVEHAQIGTLRGCGRIAAELFPKIVNQIDEEEDDTEKKKPPTATVTNFKTPTAVAFIAAGKLVIARGAAKKVVPASGTDLSLSHDGKKLLYLRNDSKMGSERTIVLYEFDSGRSKELAHGTLAQPFWSPDDTRVAFLQSQDQKWQVHAFPISAPESQTIFNAQTVDTLDGWVDAHTVLAADAQNLYWLGDDRPQQIVTLRDIYGDAFRISNTDSIRVNPINPDLLLVSAKTSAPAANTAADASGIFLYEVKAKRRVILTTPEQWANHGEWSRDGIQIFYNRRISGTSSTTFRIFWDGSGARRFQDGTDLVVGQ